MFKVRSKALPDLLDAIYRTEPNEERWAAGILEETIGFVVGADSGTSIALETRWRDDAIAIHEAHVQAIAGSNALWSGEFLDSYRALPPQFLERSFGRTHGSVASANIGLPSAVMSSTPQWATTWRSGIVDAVGLVVREPSGKGMCATVGLRTSEILKVHERRLLTKIAAHLASGFRLRRTSLTSPLDDADAVLTPNGKVLHAHELAKNKLDSLDDGRRRRDEARKMKHDAEKAIEIWKGLVAGRWSLVDHFDSDGKRFLLAMKNNPKVGQRADLTPRERRVTALVAMGNRDKEIAYMLGLSVASVTASLHRARTKLKVKTRGELVATWRGQH
jgi:DNA-binding CsgD family transcriptional regulator